MSGKYISNIVANMPDSGIKDFFDVANTMQGAISLGVGEPDFETPKHVRDVAEESIRQAKTKYTANQGTVELRQAIIEYLNQRFELKYDSIDEIIITVGASEGIDLALRAIVNPGDEVIIVEPSYVSYVPCVEMCGGVPIHLGVKAENEFKLTKEEFIKNITKKTKAIILPFPNNPTGAIMEIEDLKQIAQAAIENDILVISDEIYAELTYKKNHVSIASLDGMKERTIVLNGFSKAFAMTGWRLGYAAGPSQIIAAMNKIHQFVIMSAGTTSQYGGLEALKSPVRDEEINIMRDKYDERRKYMYQKFIDMGLSCVEPFGAFYVYPSIKSTGMTSKEFCSRLLQEEKTAVIPGDAFGQCGEGYIRCSYAYSLDTIKECMERIARFIKKIH